MKSENSKEKSGWSESIHVPENLKGRLIQAGTVKRCRKGSVIFTEKDDVDAISIVIDGYVLLYRNSKLGDEKMIFICTAGEILDEEVLDRPKPAAAARALSAVRILQINRDLLWKMLRQDVSLAAWIFSSIAEKNRRLYHQIGTSGHHYTLDKRLAAKILRLARDYSCETEEGRQIEFELSVTFLAKMVGAKRETVSREISAMKRNGLISHDNGILTILNEEALHEMISSPKTTGNIT